MSLLDNLQSGRDSKPRRILLYGQAGLGKSTFGSLAPSAVFIPTEDGLGEIDCTRFPVCKTLDEVLAALSELVNQDHNFKTVVIDSLDWLERLIWQHVCQERNVKNIEDIGYGKGYQFAQTWWRQILEALNILRLQKGMLVILLAHSQIETFQDPAGESYSRYSPRLHKKASAIVQEWCDEVLFCNYSVQTRESDEGFNNKRKIAIGGDRILYCANRPSHVAKNRLGLPEELPFSWANFNEAMSESLNVNDKF